MLALKESNLKIENKKFIDSNVELLKQIDLLKAQIETIKASAANLSEKFQIANSRIGGLTKQNNRLSSELLKTKCILESYKDCHDKAHPKKTVIQYDKRLKGFHKKKK